MMNPMGFLEEVSTHLQLCTGVYWPCRLRNSSPQRDSAFAGFFFFPSNASPGPEAWLQAPCFVGKEGMNASKVLRELAEPALGLTSGLWASRRPKAPLWPVHTQVSRSTGRESQAVLWGRLLGLHRTDDDWCSGAGPGGGGGVLLPGGGGDIQAFLQGPCLAVSR